MKVLSMVARCLLYIYVHHLPGESLLAKAYRHECEHSLVPPTKCSCCPQVADSAIESTQIAKSLSMGDVVRVHLANESRVTVDGCTDSEGAWLQD